MIRHFVLAAHQVGKSAVDEIEAEHVRHTLHFLTRRSGRSQTVSRAVPSQLWAAAYAPGDGRARNIDSVGLDLTA